MQMPDGNMELAAKLEDLLPRPDYDGNKVLNVGSVFKIKHTYFRISQITSEGITAKGISRKEFFLRRDYDHLL
jgi:hypothetical protein